MIFRKIRKSFLFFVNANGIEIYFYVLKSKKVLTFEGMVIMRKMDEMERHFADQSIKNAYLFMVVSLFIYTIFNQFQTG